MSSPDSAANGARASSTTGGRRLGSLVVLAVTVSALALLTPRLHGPALQLLPGDDPRVRADREIAAEFGFQNPIVWVVAARDGTMWTPAMLQRVATMTREVFAIPGVVATDVVSIASPNLRDLRVSDAGLEPVYLMGTVPTTPETVQALRVRVEGDPKYAGTLVSADGRAAMIVANLTAEANVPAAGAAALALRDRHRDAAADVYVSGGPVLAVLGPSVGWLLAPPLALVAAVGLVALAVLAGPTATVRIVLAALLAGAWLTLVVGGSGPLLVPWGAFALGPTVFAASLLAAVMPRVRVLVVGGLALGAGFGGLGMLADGAAAFGIAGAAGAPIAVAAALVARRLVRVTDGPAAANRAWVALTRFVFAASIIGVGMLHTSFGTAGYGLRYLGGEAGADLHAIARHFPPPTTVALRLRGPAGFVQEPATLRALDAATTTARSDPSVRSAMSLADVVKLVHRAFNDDDPEFERIPDERPLIARYLALAYSPGFRRFVDRGFERTVVWAYVDGDRPDAVARVTARMEGALATQPLPNVTVDPPGGDGAVLLVMADVAHRLALGTVVLMALLVACLGIGLGQEAAIGAAVGAMAAGGTSLGLLGWLGLPVDLLTLGATIGVSAGAGAIAGMEPHAAPNRRAFALALACAGAVALVQPFALIRVLGVFLVAPAVALGMGLRRLLATRNDAAPARPDTVARSLQRGTA